MGYGLRRNKVEGGSGGKRGIRTWCIGNTRRKLSSGHARRGDGRPRLSNVKRGRRENLRMEANLSFWRDWRSNKFFNGGKNLGELLIVLLLKRFDLRGRSRLVSIKRRSCTKARMIALLTS